MSRQAPKDAGCERQKSTDIPYSLRPRTVGVLNDLDKQGPISQEQLSGSHNLDWEGQDVQDPGSINLDVQGSGLEGVDRIMDGIGQSQVSGNNI